jgi:molybdopterin synthase sulfur carrier subunit
VQKILAADRAEAELRQHVNVFVDGRLIKNRGTLTDAVGDDTRVLILQALSGG